MAEFRYCIADVFTGEPFGGNPLAVLPRADGLDDGRMQQIAREFNLSETVFVLPPEDPAHTRRLRIFTPGGELPFAGHPTIGAAHVLAALGEIELAGEETPIVFEQGIGPVAVAIRAREGRPDGARLTTARLPEAGPPPPAIEELAALLGLAPAELDTDGLGPQAWSCGVPFLIVPVRDTGALARVEFDRARWQATLAAYWAPQLYLVTRAGVAAGTDLRARMFAPAMGILEDPATGAAAAALAGYLVAVGEGAGSTRRWAVEQGVEMGRRSRLEVEADVSAGAVTAVRVGGGCVLLGEGCLRLPDSGGDA
ncbi:MAG: PhzF family phenazine biosynthesis protein [Halofilum sp. (in: g-proteobacteria)]|nr:PhzF family phenazine biosynthesis protein [Halofilum sp. (in: g-proteobacteria)]